ncbi:MAG: AAA family ATPase [Acidimicrobiia bacterium]
MRPLHLSLSGFTTFRDTTEVDFTDADLFVLSGPTGSGKSSIIDAICFSLYGAIPRMSGVAPVISLGRNEAKLRLRFEVGGEVFTVSRLVARQGDGATQKDVRLEGGGAIVEGVREVNARIERLLGLGFDHFTRTVVLPQGRFAAFLEDTPANREHLLKQLLDLGVYEEMRKRAAAHATRLDTEVGSLDTQLHDLLVSAADVSRLEAQVGRVRSFVTRVSEVVAELAQSDTARQEASTRLSVLDDELERLDRLQPPAEVRTIAEELTASRLEADTRSRELQETEHALAEATELRLGLGEAAAVRAVLEAHARVNEARQRVGESEEARSRAADALSIAGKAEQEAREVLAEAAGRLADAERTHAAHAVRETLAVGDMCPVCAQVVVELPDGAPPADLETARAAHQAAHNAWVRAEKAKQDAQAQVAAAESRLHERREALAAAEAAVEGALPPDELRATLSGIEQAEERLAGLRRQLQERRRAAEIANDHLTRAVAAAQAASSALDRARDTVAALDPPLPDRQDPAADWAVLVTWRESQQTRRKAEREAVRAELAELDTGRSQLRTRLEDEAAELGIGDLGEDPKVTVATWSARLESELDRLRSDLERKTALEERRATLRADKAGYDELARLLRSNNFQQWLLEEAMAGLVEVANSELAKLAGGAYSLAVDAGDFEVIDHRNAEARRSVKTLSGGETFLVSLALALALAERVVATSAVGTARLESMFLDEGFGTLDAETLDTVAAVVQELGSGERMIGLVTHVRELADQIPVRYEVKKLPGGSTVTRVDA